jgi:hypothetical protein
VAARVADLQASLKAFEDADKKARAASAASQVDAALANLVDAGYPVAVARIDGLDAALDLARATVAAQG